MDRTLRRVAAVLVAAVLVAAILVATAGGSAATAQETPEPPALQLVEPDVFVPDDINRTPEGDVIPDDAAGVVEDGPSSVLPPGAEVVERRTEDSTTVVGEDGSFETTFHGAPIHYQDPEGTWQPIDNALVPVAPGPGVGAGGAGLRNAAGPVALSLPPALGVGPVTVSQDDVSVGFTLQGAKGTPSIGPPEVLPTPATEEAVEATATYAGALPGVDVAYTATGAGVKEDVVLAGPDSPITFDFTVEASPGLSAVESPAGGIDFVDGQGEVRADFAPPFAYDANFRASGAEASFTEEAVSLHIVETSPELVVRLAADEAWLDAPERAWPVVLDPVLSISGPAVDTYLLSSSPTANYGSSTYLRISAGSSVRRPMYGNPPAGYFDEPVTVVAAQLQLYADVTQLSPTSPVAAHVIDTPGWNSNQATWNNRLTGTPWNSPGGDYVPEAAWVHPDIAGAPGWRSWDITQATQGWLDGEPDLGVVLKHVNEASGASIYFASSNHAEAALRPKIVIQWEPLAGLRSPFSFEEFDLGEAGAASVNVASGNLTIADRDLAIPGPGIATTVDRFYQSRIATMGSVGARWRMWPQSEERLYFLDGGHVALAGSPEEALILATPTAPTAPPTATARRWSKMPTAGSPSPPTATAPAAASTPWGTRRTSGTATTTAPTSTTTTAPTTSTCGRCSTPRAGRRPSPAPAPTGSTG